MVLLGRSATCNAKCRASAGYLSAMACQASTPTADALQVSLGITNVLGGLPLPVAVAHNGIAAVLLLTLLTLVHTTRRKETLPSC